jgi:hypothetical protein
MFFVNASPRLLLPGEINIEDAGLKKPSPCPNTTRVGYIRSGTAFPASPPQQGLLRLRLSSSWKPTFQYPLDEGLRLSTSLPLTTTKPGLTNDDSDWDKKLGRFQLQLKIGPNVSVFFLKTSSPLRSGQYITVRARKHLEAQYCEPFAKFYLSSKQPSDQHSAGSAVRFCFFCTQTSMLVSAVKKQESTTPRRFRGMDCTRNGRVEDQGCLVKPRRVGPVLFI